jgi:hypothetical protein
MGKFSSWKFQDTHVRGSILQGLKKKKKKQKKKRETNSVVVL